MADLGGMNLDVTTHSSVVCIVDPTQPAFEVGFRNFDGKGNTLTVSFCADAGAETPLTVFTQPDDEADGAKLKVLAEDEDWRLVPASELAGALGL